MNSNVVKFKNKFTVSKLFIHLVLGIFSLACILPIILVAAISLTPEKEIVTKGYSLIPANFTLDAYKFVLRDPTEILRAYGITIIVTICGTLLGIWLTTTIAYVISRKDYRYRNGTSFFLFFTMLFSGGLTPFYILVAQTLHMKDTLLALIIPAALQAWYVILMKGFLQGISMSMIESAKIDGASELKTFISIVVPVAKPGIATIGLFLLLQFWNDWYASLLFINNNKLVSLQYLLYRIMADIEYIKNVMSNVNVSGVDLNNRNIPSLGSRMAMCLIAAGPMLVIFTFFQKYFIKGITIGSIKG
jgi:putative aldouronate transport system permease protein